MEKSPKDEEGIKVLSDKEGSGKAQLEEEKELSAGSSGRKEGEKRPSSSGPGSTDDDDGKEKTEEKQEVKENMERKEEEGKEKKRQLEKEKEDKNAEKEKEEMKEKEVVRKQVEEESEHLKEVEKEKDEKEETVVEKEEKKEEKKELKQIEKREELNEGEKEEKVGEKEKTMKEKDATKQEKEERKENEKLREEENKEKDQEEKEKELKSEEKREKTVEEEEEEEKGGEVRKKEKEKELKSEEKEGEKTIEKEEEGEKGKELKSEEKEGEKTVEEKDEEINQVRLQLEELVGDDSNGKEALKSIMVEDDNVEVKGETLKPGTPVSSLEPSPTEDKEETKKTSIILLEEKEEEEEEEKEKSDRTDPQIPVPPELNQKEKEEGERKEKEKLAKLMPNSALNICWSFTFNQNIPVWNLTQHSQTIIMYTSSHTGIIYNFTNNTQTILQGHANSISCTTLSADKKWLVTADKGKDSTVIVWSTRTSFPIRTLFNASSNGMEAVTLTPDAKYLATMSAGQEQELCIWDWTVSDDKSVASVTLDAQFGGQNYIYFCEENTNYIVTNSENQVIFYQWKDDTLTYFAPPLTDQDFHIQIGKYSQSIIIEDTIHALTGTSVGNLVVWDTNISFLEGKKRQIANKRASKIMKLAPGGITVLTLQDKVIIIGDMDGNVSFFDQRMTLLHSFSSLGVGPVKSLSFSFPTVEDKNILFPQMYPKAAGSISLPDFTISSLTAQCALIHVHRARVQMILSDHGKPIPAIAAHPFKPFIATGSHAGLLKLYDYVEKQPIANRCFEKEMIECCAFSPDGYHLALGFFSGVIQVLDSFTLTAGKKDVHNYSKHAIIRIVFSGDSKYLAAADKDYTTALLKKEEGSSFVFLGRYHAHYKPIRELMFAEKFDSEEPRLLSLGEDRMLVEYDLAASSEDDIRILSIERIEQSATPRCMAWHPPLNKEHFIVTANDQYKYKLYNSTTMMCRKTTLAPIYDFPIEKLIVLPTEGVDPKHMYMAFITLDKVGLQILPFDGNPHQSTALIAHSGGVQNLVASYDGSFVFTTSTQEPSVFMWQINANALEAQLHLGGEDLIPFYQFLEGGLEGPFMEELKEYFYFCQLQSTDLNSMNSRIVSTTVPVKEIPNLMRALGFFPSEQELADMVNEVKYSEYVDKGEFKEEINLADFIKLYINHRPYRNFMAEKLQWAFKVLGQRKKDLGESSLPTNEMISLIQSQGEHITSEELDEILMDICLLDLDCSNELGNCKGGGQIKDFSHLASFIDAKLPEVMTSFSFAYNFLDLPEKFFKA